MDPKIVQKTLAQGKRHVHFVRGLDHVKLQYGRNSLDEHLAKAMPWNNTMTVYFLKQPRVMSIVSAQREYGLTTGNDAGQRFPHAYSLGCNVCPNTQRAFETTPTHAYSSAIDWWRAAAAAFDPCRSQQRFSGASETPTTQRTTSTTIHPLRRSLLPRAKLQCWTGSIHLSSLPHRNKEIEHAAQTDRPSSDTRAAPLKQSTLTSTFENNTTRTSAHTRRFRTHGWKLRRRRS